MKNINPMGPRLAEYKYKNDENYLYQIKWDGVRILAIKEKSVLTLVNRYHRDKTVQFPELQILKEVKEDFVIDGELMVVEGKKNSFSKILRRNLTNDLNKIRFLKEQIPITYAVFDILSLNGNSLMNEGIEKRISILTNLLGKQIKGNDTIHICKSFDDGVSLFSITEDLGLEGMIAKRRGSKYIQGKKSFDWIKYKHKRVIKPYIGGIMVENNRVRSLAVGVIDDEGSLIHIGNVGAGLSENDKQDILQKSISIVKEESKFKNFNNRKHIWLNPEVRCYIEFMEWTDDYTLRSPVFKGLLED